MFTHEGPVQLVVGRIEFAECRFPEGKGANDFDIWIEVTNAADENEHGAVILEWSENYGRGNFATSKQKDITLKTLRGVGFQGDDLSELPDQLGGKTVPGKVIKKNGTDGKVFYNVFLGGGGGMAPKAEDVLTKDEIRKRINGATGSGAAKPKINPFKAAAAQAPASDSDDNLPF
jgi:hypothetical protein